MKPSDTDTIAALATPPGRGGVAVVRISGPGVRTIAERFLGGVPRPRHADYRPFHDPGGQVIDEGIALFFAAPASFTGEDVLELQAHGGPLVADMLLEAASRYGARMAAPGEFSQRAFLNGKLDLAQAEAVADLIEAGSREAARSALASLQGAFSRRVEALAEALTELRMYVESAIDFPEEEIDFLADGAAGARLAALQHDLASVRAAARQGRLLRDGMTVVLAGVPNAGKSSLLNALAGSERAIVTDIPGTTRDLLREYLAVDGMPLHIIDTAGLRESADPVEQEGIRRAWAAIESADRLLLLVDDAVGIGRGEAAILERLPDALPVTVVRNKIDLTGRDPGEGSGPHGPELALCARDGRGIDLLRAHLKRAIGYSGGESAAFSARRRHLVALEATAAHIQTAVARLGEGSGELVAEELRLAQHQLGEITGAVTSDDLLGRIFASFCIGK